MSFLIYVFPHPQQYRKKSQLPTLTSFGWFFVYFSLPQKGIDVIGAAYFSPVFSTTNIKFCVWKTHPFQTGLNHRWGRSYT